MKSLEHNAQKALFIWASLASGRYPELDLLFAIPNAHVRTAFQGNWMKDEGLKTGVPDIFLPVSRDGFVGLFIEMKTASGRLTENQRWWLLHLENEGYKAELCCGFDEAKQTIEEYLNLKSKVNAGPYSNKSIKRENLK